jgi:YD repeat-containing protein
MDYDTDGNLVKVTDQEGNEIKYEFDLDGHFVKHTDGNSNLIDLIYDPEETGGCSSCSGGAVDQVKVIRFPTFTREFKYDKRNRKIREIDFLTENDWVETRFAYDLAGNLVSKVDKKLNTTTYEYDDLGRLTKVIDDHGGETTYEYDHRDNLKSLEDADKNTTWFEYDLNNRLKKEIRPMGEETTYDYDGAGNLIEKIDAKNQVTKYEYDDAGRLEWIRYFSSSDHETPAKTVNFTYYDNGNLESYDDGTTTGFYTYDGENRKLS